jgi:hypothetical protein
MGTGVAVGVGGGAVVDVSGAAAVGDADCSVTKASVARGSAALHATRKHASEAETDFLNNRSMVFWALLPWVFIWKQSQSDLLQYYQTWA